MKASKFNKSPYTFVSLQVRIWRACTAIRVSFETSFDSKQPKLEPKWVSALSETKRLFRLFRFYTETESFDVSIEPKQTEDQPNSLIGSIFYRKFRVFPFFLGFPR
jgi:hypothetical protein